MGRSGLAVLAIGAFDVALWHLKAKRAGLSLAKLLGARRDSVRCYNASGSYEHTARVQLLGTTDRSRWHQPGQAGPPLDPRDTVGFGSLARSPDGLAAGTARGTIRRQRSAPERRTDVFR